MASILKSLSLIADPTRVRILLLLKKEELSVAELQEVLALPQSNISAQLAKLKSAGLVTDRRSGKNRLYQLDEPSSKDKAAHEHFIALMEAAGAELKEAKKDDSALKVVLRKRTRSAQAYFDTLAGKFGRHYIPGRSWKGLGETLLKLLPPLVIADLGAGEGTLSQLLAQRAEKVIAVDNSEKMVAYGADLAAKHGFTNLEYRLGDIEEPPISPGTVDLVFLSQALHHALNPDRAIRAAFTILKPGGRIVILDLLKHQFEKARELYADVWLGFSEAELHEMLSKAGFQQTETSLVHRESQSPHFQTILALAQKA
ncbi:ArsR family transcriptional regulator [Prosthecobacter fusiformis]|uniref:ArsR family transcriptional regulator n=1 Tax=Prosthecobacter fusiformis TaxID=48464 RepID=A0A4R7RY02_9BACT|nr:metalloregulator ArsR/SmtB family transcription factor [Prosthecobacter fusiformis]TDU70804.1 ArsR family transcriptional regulator [Prosthecobacter fusiformis]